MNQATTSVPGASLLPESTDLFTAGHLLILAVLALLVLAGLIWGIRNARARRDARRELIEHNQAVIEEQAESPPPPVAAAPAVEPPVAATRTEAPTASAPTDAVVVEAEAAPIEPLTSAAEIAPAITATPEEPPVMGENTGPSPADGPITQLKGLGPKLASRLNELGITTVGDLAALNDDDAATLDARLGPFTGRMARDRWQEQARFLAAGDIKGFEAVFGRL